MKTATYKFNIPKLKEKKPGSLHQRQLIFQLKDRYGIENESIVIWYSSGKRIAFVVCTEMTPKIMGLYLIVEECQTM